LRNDSARSESKSIIQPRNSKLLTHRSMSGRCTQIIITYHSSFWFRLVANIVAKSASAKYQNRIYTIELTFPFKGLEYLLNCTCPTSQAQTRRGILMPPTHQLGVAFFASHRAYVFSVPTVDQHPSMSLHRNHCGKGFECLLIQLQKNRDTLVLSRQNLTSLTIRH
jgi:hypothetical protein